MFIHDIDNSILLSSGERVSNVYQDKSEKWELYQEISFFDLEPKRKNYINRCTSYSCNNKHMKFINIPLHPDNFQ